MSIILYTDYTALFTTALTTAQINILIGHCQGLAEEYCNRKFDEAAFTGVFNGDGSDQLQLRNYPVTAITSITIRVAVGGSTVVYTGADITANFSWDDSADGDGLLTWIDAASGRYGVDDHGLNDAWGTTPCFPEGRQNVTIEYTGGYSSGAMPASLKAVMLQMVNTRDRMGAGSTGTDPALTGETYGRHSKQWANQNPTTKGGFGMLSEAELAALYPWRREVVTA